MSAPYKEKVVCSDQELWSLLHGMRRPVSERYAEMFRLLYEATKGFSATQQLELVVREREKP